MRVILSRKGFDSKYGGIPSPVLSDGTMASLPIPYIEKTDRDKLDKLNDEIEVDKFGNVDLPGGEKASEVIVNCLKKWDLSKDSYKMQPCPELQDVELDTFPCHLDPDIYEPAKDNRIEGWRGCFGQDFASLSHLDKYGIGKDDIFLFFGWFCKKDNYSKAKGQHMLFGYLQVDEVIDYSEGNKEPLPEWAMAHPHIKYPMYGETSRNKLFLASEKLSIDESLPGWGTFSFDEKLVLTEDGMSRSKWKSSLPFRDCVPTHHTPASWKNKGDKEYFQSATIGQEFIFPESDEITKWAHDIILSGMSSYKK